MSSTAMTNDNWTLHAICVPAADACHPPSQQQMKSACVEPTPTNVQLSTGSKTMQKTSWITAKQEPKNGQPVYDGAAGLRSASLS